MEIAGAASSRSFSTIVGLFETLVVLLILTGPAQAQDAVDDAAKVTSCGVSIKACGCTITSPGFYDVAATLLDVELNQDTSCIAIKAPNVVLALSGMDITGAGAGIGVHVLPSATNSFLAGGGGTISGWGTGILVEANDAVVQNITTSSNATAGIELHQAKYVTVNDVNATSNKLEGVWLNNASFNQVSISPVAQPSASPTPAGISGNMGPGILIGCTSGCPKSAVSNHNRIIGNTLSKNKTGILITPGSQHNVITGNSVTGSTPGDDLMDSNIDCGTDIWFGNMIDVGSAEPATCVN